MKYIFKFIPIILFLVPGILYSQTGDSGTSLIFAKKLYEDKMYDLAAEQFHQFSEQNPNNPKAAEALYLAGLSYVNIEEYQKAKKEFLSLILKFPDAKDLDRAQFKIAECFQAQRDFSAAANTYRQVQVFYPRSPLAEQALFMSAKMFFDDKQFEKILEVLYEFLEIYPMSRQFHEAQLLIADSFIQLENYDRARVEIDKVLATTESGQINATALLMKANLSYRSHQLQQAENDYQKLVEKYAISQFSRNPEITKILNEAYYYLGDIFHKKGMFEKSNENLYKILDYENDPKTLFLIAENHLSSGAYSQAIDRFKKITSISDSTHLVQAHFKIGDSYFALNDYVNAITAYEKAIKTCETNLTQYHGPALCNSSYIKIADCYLNLNQPNVAISYLKKYRVAVKEGKNIDVIDYRIAYLYETKARDFERAIRAYYDFIDNYPQSKLIDEAQFGLARAYEGNSNYTQALIEYKSLMNRYPASEHYAEAEKRIIYLKNYYQIEGAALKNLSGVIQQLAENRTNATALYYLGLIYFKELKDYRASINLFDKIYDSDEKENIPEDELLYYRGRAYQLLGEKSIIDNQEQIALLDSANLNYDQLIENIPASSWADDAAFHKIEIKRLNLKNDDPNYFPQMKEILTSFTYKYLDSPILDKVNFELALLMLKNGINSSIDSLDVYNNLQKIINDFPLSPLLPVANYYQTSLFFQVRNLNLAENKLNTFISAYPNNNKTCEAYFQLAKLAELKADYSVAIKSLQQIITKYYYSDYADSATLIIGSYFTKQHKFAEALSHYMDIYEEYETNTIIFEGTNHDDNDWQILQDVIFNIATILKTTNHRDEAIQFYQKYLVKFPKGKYTDQVLFSLGELFNTAKKEEQSKARDYLQQLEKNHSTSDLLPKSLINLGDLAYQVEKYDEARQYYSKALNAQLSNEEQAYTSAQIIICLYRSGEVAQADESYKAYRKQFKDEKSRQAEILLEKGDYFLKEKNFEPAEKIFKDVRSDFKNTPEGLKAEYLLGKLYFILNKDEDALEILSDLIKKHPDASILPEIYITLGNFYYLQAKQIENALLAYKNAIDQKGITEQNLKIGMHNLIKCYGDLQLWEKAIGLSRKYLEKFPLAEDAFEKKIQIGYYYFRLNEYDYAIQSLRQILPEADIDNEPRIQYWIAECYFGKGQFQQAISEYLKIAYFSKPAKLLSQYKVTAQYQAAISYVKLGRLENARQLFQRIITEQGAESVFGKPAKEKLEEIDRMIAEGKQGNL